MIRSLTVLCIILAYVIPSSAVAEAMTFGVSEYGGVNQCLHDAGLVGAKHCVSYVRIGEIKNIASLQTPKDWGATIVIKFPEVSSGTVHDSIMAGDFDSELKRLTVIINDAKRPVWLRPMPEANSWWNPDAVYRPGQSHESYNAAMKYIVAFMRNNITSGLISGFELNLNFATFPKEGKPGVGTSDFYKFVVAGLEYDRVTFPGYNRCGTNEYFKLIRPFEEAFGPAFREAKLLFPRNMTFGVSEVASSPYCGVDLVAWYSDVLTYLEKTNVTSVMFFFENKSRGASNQKNTRWGAVLEEHPKEFRALLDEYRQRWNAQPTKEMESKTNHSYRAPWSVNVQFTDLFSETSNPALNPVTGNMFGKEEFVFRGLAVQKFLFGIGDGYEFGPGLRLGAVESTNDDQWWNNQISAGATLGFYHDLPRGVIKWGGWSVELFAERRYYTTDVPERYDDDVEDRIGVRLGVNFGGDWTR